MIAEVSQGSTAKANYTYLADGQKAAVRGAGNDGFDYLGNIVLARSGSSLSTEAYFPEGMIKGNEVTYFERDHLGSVRVAVNANGAILGRNDYTPFGKRHTGGPIDANNRYLFNGKESQITGDLALLDYGWRMYDPELARWFGIDKLANRYYAWSPYAYTLNNPIKFIDPDGRRPIPLHNPYNNWSVKVDSWFGPRNTGLDGASTYHKGLDFNYSGGGNTDYGTPILATHEGTVSVDNDPSGGAGRSVYVTSPDGSFRTAYFHLSEINVEEGQYISESDNIAKMGGSAAGSDKKWQSHLHYEIQEMQDGKWVSINPTEGQANEMSNIIDPQKRITPVDQTPAPSAIPSTNPFEYLRPQESFSNKTYYYGQ